ncbi:MAG: RecX family transcriptional regulator [Bacteroidales bacterium]|nr:RecX family transcriptional regulator [Bacteroidales bacterium]
MDRLLDRMRRLCSRREYCSSDILKKLMDATDGDRAKSAKILSVLVEERYVDDLRYASAYARDKAALSGWGESKIRYMLSSKGIAKDLIAKAMEEIDDVKAYSRLEKLMENKYRSLKEDPQCRLKMLRFGLGRGYSYDEVSKVLELLDGIK